MKAALALSLLLFNSSTLAAVVGKGVTCKAGDADSWIRTLAFLQAARQ